MRRTLLCMLGLMLLPSVGHAQKFFYTRYGTAQGLPSNEVRALTRDSIGFVWVATDNGLARYDGQRFTTYQTKLESRYVKALIQQPDGTLLLANDAGIFAVSPETDTATVRRVVGAHPQPTDSTVLYPNGLHRDARGTLWISQPNGTVARYRNGRLRRFSFGDDHTTGTSASDFSFVGDARGGLWMAARTGQLYRFSPEAQRFRRVRLPEPMGRVHDLRVEADTLWVVGDRLIRARITQQGTLADVRTFSTDGRICTSMSNGPEGFLLGTQENGLFRAEVNASGLRMQQVFGSNDPHRIEELPFRNIHHVYVDRDGSVWLSSRQGLGLLQSRFFSGVAGMTQNNTLSVHPDGERVLLSFGDVVEVQPGTRTDFTVRILPSSDESFVTSLAAAADRLWMGTANGWLRASSEGRIVRTLDLTDRGGGIFYMYSDRRGSVWLCQAPTDTPLKGVTKIEPNGEMRFYDADDGVENRILVLKEGPRGTLYAAGIGPETYLFRYQPDRDRFINLSLPLPFSYSQNFEVHDLAVDTRGIVWLATTDGLLRYDLERVHRVDLGEFTATEIRSLEAMPDGSIWMATDTQGLLHYRNGTVVQFAESTGLPTKVSVYRTLRKDGQGRIWVGTAEGAVHSRDRRPTPDPTPIPVVLSAAVNGRSVSNADPIAVGRRDVLSLRYAALTFPATHLRYQYRLRGGPDTSWSDPVARNRLRLNRLPLGDHTLEIRAREGDGHYWSAALRIPIEVHPVWYRTWWAYLVYVLGGSAVLAYGVHRSVMRQRRRIHELEDALAEREEEIEAKDRKLQRQHQDLEEVEAALSSQEHEARTARTTLNVLHDVIQDLPTNASWSEVVHTLAGAVEEIDGIDAFEFGYFDEGSICYEGYDQRRHTYTHRREDFDEKTVVPVWSLVNDEPVRIGDYRREHTQYVHPNQAYRYQSMLCLPFHLPGRQHLVFVVYGVPKHTFDEQDLMMAQVLVDYLGVALKRPLEPTARD